MHLELGIDTFGDVTAGGDGRALTEAEVIRDVVEEAVWMFAQRLPVEAGD